MFMKGEENMKKLPEHHTEVTWECGLHLRTFYPILTSRYFGQKAFSIKHTIHINCIKYICS